MSTSPAKLQERKRTDHNPGIPIIYQGQEQHFDGGSVPLNREALWTSGYDTSAELYSWIAEVNQIRNKAISDDPDYLYYQAWPFYSDSSNIGMRKGFDGHQVISAFSNVGSGGSASFTLDSDDTGFTANEALVEVMSCASVTADGSGNVAVSISAGVPWVLYPKAALSGSGICSQ